MKNNQKDFEDTRYHFNNNSELQQSKFDMQVANLSPRDSIMRQKTRYAELEKYFPHGSKGRTPARTIMVA